MSGEERDYFNRLLPGPLVHVGVGSTVEEAAEDKRRAKRKLVPTAVVQLPRAASDDFADREIETRLERIFDLCAEINGILEGLPDTVYPRPFHNAVQLSLFEAMTPLDPVWQAVGPRPARGTLVGDLLGALRSGVDPKSIEVTRVPDRPQ